MFKFLSLKHSKSLAAFSFDLIGAKEKANKKKTPFMGGVAPPPYELFRKKLDQNFFLGCGANFIIK